uniref:Uncharacterized protein n=1 Tax=Setaria digitata TaxID=48799 RepID=A0A915PZE7_9BILA
MTTNVRFFILFLTAIKLTILELLSHTIIKFEPFQATDILSAYQHFNTSIADTKFSNDNVKIVEKRRTNRDETLLAAFDNLLEQRIRGNIVPQCPCVIKPGTNKCIAYDSRYQAASIEEALVAFRDVTMDDDIFLPPDVILRNISLQIDDYDDDDDDDSVENPTKSSTSLRNISLQIDDYDDDDDDDSVENPTKSSTSNADVFACRSLECQTCAAILLRRIKQMGMVPMDVKLSIKLPETFDPRHCPRIRFIRPVVMPTVPQESPFMGQLMDRGLRYAGILRPGQPIFFTPARRNRSRSTTRRPPPLPPRIPRPPSLPQLPQRSRLVLPPLQPQPPLAPPPPPPQLPLPPPLSLRLPPLPQPLSPQPAVPVVPPPRAVVPASPTSVISTPVQRQFHSQLFQPSNLLEYASPRPWFPGYNAEIGGRHRSERKKSKKRIKRRADPPVLGTRYVISCMQHGEADDDGMLALCSTCWTWRKLPSDYFPPLINELVCGQDNDGHCLSGWGKCQQKYRNFDVLRKVNGNWQPTTISTATCCDCRIRAGTEIHPLVVGKRQS